MKVKNPWEALNGSGKVSVIGTIVLGLLILFSFLGSVPWATKAEVATLKGDLHRELSAVREDVREVRDLVRELIRR